MANVPYLLNYGPTFYPAYLATPKEKYEWGKDHIEKKVGNEKFFHFFAVHETEAWLLSEPNLFPTEVKRDFPDKISKPESVNFDQPPAKLLDSLFNKTLNRNYKKVVDGKNLFSRLNPVIAYDKCPRLKDLLDQMLILAKGAGL